MQQTVSYEPWFLKWTFPSWQLPQFSPSFHYFTFILGPETAKQLCGGWGWAQLAQETQRQRRRVLHMLWALVRIARPQRPLWAHCSDPGLGEAPHSHSWPFNPSCDRGFQLARPRQCCLIQTCKTWSDLCRRCGRYYIPRWRQITHKQDSISHSAIFFITHKDECSVVGKAHLLLDKIQTAWTCICFSLQSNIFFFSSCFCVTAKLQSYVLELTAAHWWS